MAKGDALSTRFGRYAFALGLVAVATLARGLAEPFMGSQAPYLFHLLAVIIATWSAPGRGAGGAAPNAPSAPAATSCWLTSHASS